MDVTIPLWFKVAYTGMVVLVVPVYAVCYGWRNFLWFSDIALLATCAALWLDSALVASTMAVGVLLPELLWTASFFSRLLFRTAVSDLAGYMFDARIPRFLRALSLFHLVLPGTLLWLVADLGYDRRALVAQTLLACAVLPLTYAVVRPGDENINWVRGLGERQERVPPRLYLGLLMLGLVLGVYVPTHFALAALFPPP